MLTQTQIDRLKPGDKVRLCGFDGKSYKHYNGTIVEVVDPNYKMLTKKYSYSFNCIKFTPALPEIDNQKECDLVFYNNVELVEENSPQVCTCDIMIIMRVGCICGGQ